MQIEKAPDVQAMVEDIIETLNLDTQKDKKLMVVLDSNHTEEHVYQELQIFSKIVTKGNYLLVLDTVIEFLKSEKNKEWGPSNSPLSAVKRFLNQSNDYVIDDKYGQFGDISVAINGFLRKISARTA